MKTTQLFAVLVSVFVIQSAFALTINVKNEAAGSISVVPVWSDTKELVWNQLDQGGSHAYSSYGLQKLQSLKVRLEDGEWPKGLTKGMCFVYNCGSVDKLAKDSISGIQIEVIGNSFKQARVNRRTRERTV